MHYDRPATTTEGYDRATGSGSDASAMVRGTDASVNRTPVKQRTLPARDDDLGNEFFSFFPRFSCNFHGIILLYALLPNTP